MDKNNEFENKYLWSVRSNVFFFEYEELIAKGKCIWVSKLFVVPNAIQGTKNLKRQKFSESRQRQNIKKTC